MWPIQADDPFAMCKQLFRLSPAVEPVSGRMILAVGAEHRRYLTLTRAGVEQPSFVLADWTGDRVVTIRSDGATINSGLDDLEVDRFLDWALNGIPVPRHGTVFGEVRGLLEKRVVALLTFRSARAVQQPGVEMEVLIDAELSGASAGNLPISYWWTQVPSNFWTAWRIGIIVDLAEHFRQRRETVWRMNVSRIATPVFAVAEDITVAGITLPQGRFAAATALRRQRTIPSLAHLLAYTRKTDQFNAFARAD